MSNHVAHKSWWQVFEVVFGIPFLAAIALQLITPIPLPGGFITPFRIIGGAILVVIGVVFIVNARREFRRYSQPTDPGHPTTRIISTGVFSVSRNPLYLGGIFFLSGISMAFNLSWFFILLIPTVVACHYILIAPEEKYLQAMFGDQYQLYAERVHRWLGRKKG